MAVWITSDWHFGDDRVVMHRPFKTKEQSIETIIKNFNSVVAKDDFVYVVGDVVYKDELYLEHVGKLNGDKCLIRGNHDRFLTDEKFSPYFKYIIPEGQGVELTIGELDCFITHYPSTGRKDRFNLVGHIHGAWKVQLNMLNIGIDVHHFLPLNIDNVQFYFDAITKYYDKDVWTAYEPMNYDYHSIRGKSTSYFDESK